MNNNQKGWIWLMLTFGIFFGTCTAIIISPSIYTVMSFLILVPIGIVSGVLYERHSSFGVEQ